jgi:hypothetical protein
VKLWVAIVLILLIDALAAGIFLLVRRYGPAAGWFRDTQHASGAFTVTGTIFAVLVGFVFLLAFGSYSNARTSSQEEALATLSLFHVAERFPDDQRDELQSDVVCYARAVAGIEWTTMANGGTSSLVDFWERKTSGDLDQHVPQGMVEGDAAQNWFTESDAMRQARQGRIAEAPRFVPGTIWFLLLLAGAAVAGFTLLFADRRERRFSQVAVVISVTTAVAVSLLIVNFLDRPYGDHEGAIKATAMRASLQAQHRDLVADGRADIPSCDAIGRPLSS